MMDVSHELGSLRYVVVAMFNNHAEQHQQSQLRNPFSGRNERSSPKPSFSKDEYGKPKAGSLTEMRGQKANMHILKEMVELCQIIDSEGYKVTDEPSMRVIPFGELFNIYNSISDKVVGILLRARKHKLVSFEGEILFQRRDDDVPIFLLKPIKEICDDLHLKIEEIKRASSPAPQATSVLMDRSGMKLSCSSRNSVSPSASTGTSPVRKLFVAAIDPELDKNHTTIHIFAPEMLENAKKLNPELNNHTKPDEQRNVIPKLITEQKVKAEHDVVSETEIFESFTEIEKENLLLKKPDKTFIEKLPTEITINTEMPIVIMEATAENERSSEILTLKNPSTTTKNYLP
ncbi:uncharacterized protein LOC119668066 isoform X2 [Teleopsis dalmanni]|uniref:uncharacterized protein LOC119668066 isoform X2 n=1 Tax=Teleopsis dalmanni TaxID=139649 RepID=UPI0018CDDB6C|nr:uncharacterized protein LOC119668066 isoform X2 [Teleopsis dalmanni]